MSTDLRTALRTATDDAPPHVVDPAALLAAGRQRVRRRAGRAVGASVVAAATVLGAVVLLDRPSDVDPPPAKTVRLDVDEAPPTRPAVVARTRTTDEHGGGPASLSYDRLQGITADGLVLRARHADARGTLDLGLLDPGTGATEWLPPAPSDAGEVSAVDLGADRLVLAERSAGVVTLLALDRSTRTWRRAPIEVPGYLGPEMPTRMAMSPDGRVWIGSLAGDRFAWWSADASGAGTARPEPAFTDSALAWGDATMAQVDTDGRVVLTGPRGELVVSQGRPAGCSDRPTDLPAALVLAGDRPVVTTWGCRTARSALPEPLTTIHGEEGEAQVQVAGAVALVADDQHVLLEAFPPRDSNRPHQPRLYVVDLEELTIGDLGEGPYHEDHVAVGAGLLLWNLAAGRHGADTYDARWTVARVG